MKNDENDPVTKKVLRTEMEKIHAKFLSKQEFMVEMRKVDGRFEDIDNRLVGMKQYIDFRFDEFKAELEDVMYTKADHHKFMVLFDEAMTELRENRHERILGENQKFRMDDQIADHERRIRVLEV